MKKTIALIIMAAAFSGCIRFKTPTHDIEVEIPMEAIKGKAE